METKSPNAETSPSTSPNAAEVMSAVDNGLPSARLWRKKSEYDIFHYMAIRSCRVTLEDLDGVMHSVDVTAATLYEAVAQGLAAIRGNEWVVGIAQGRNTVKVSVADVRVEHEVRLGEFTKLLERPGGSPREVSDRHRIRLILGMPASR